MPLKFFILFCLLSVTACTSSNSSHRGIASEHDSEVTSAQTDTPGSENSDIRVVMDINPAVQKMIVYRGAQVAYTFPISSGRGTFDIPTNFNKNPSCSTTTPGSFQGQTLREAHYSNTWLTRNPETGRYEDGALMAHSIFYNGGEAIHAAGTEEASQALGPKTPEQTSTGSGGCVRLFPWDARTLFDEIAACDRYETERVCVEREVTLPSARISGLDNSVVQVPRCLRFENRRRCVDYTSAPDCSPTARPGWCQDPKQFTVARQSRNFNVQVTDSRPQAARDAERAKCEADRLTFNQRKTECFGSILNLDPHTQSTAFQQEFDRLSTARRGELSRMCNERLYNEAVVARGGSPTTAGATATTPATNSAEAPPLSPIPPRRPFRETGLGRWFNRTFGGPQ